jgi:predicted hydrocarbon binding protein
MTEEILNKEIAQKAMEIKGEARGVSFKGELEYILKEKGKEGLEKVEEAMAEAGAPIKYKEISDMRFYPIGMEVVTMLAIKKVFNFDEEDFRKMGEFESKLSLIVRVFMKHLFSIEAAAKEAPRVWRKNYTIGSLKVSELNKEQKYVTLRVEDFFIHPIICQILEGYFGSIGKMIVNAQVTCEEVKCMHRGDKYHEFLLKW